MSPPGRMSPPGGTKGSTTAMRSMEVAWCTR